MTSKENQAVIDRADTLKETLDWVGINAMHLPVKYSAAGELTQSPAQIELAVSLDDPEVKGIDMAELYFNTQELLANQEIDFIKLKELSDKLLEAHKDRSSASRVELAFDIFAKKETLRSGSFGYRVYPLSLELVNFESEYTTCVNFEILYASVCPCSESAARQENLAQFGKYFANHSKEDFKSWYLNQDNKFAYPHAQKSKAKFALELPMSLDKPVDFVLDMIVGLETEIGTAVHSAVRQEDEAAFTAKMGENLIFIEDAAKRFKSYIKSQDMVLASAVELVHFESIHPHNAKVFFTT